MIRIATWIIAFVMLALSENVQSIWLDSLAFRTAVFLGFDEL